MSKKKGGGFLTALILAAVSFLVIFFFFTDVSDKYFGVSYKGDAREQVEKALDSETVTNIVNSTTEKAKDVVSDITSLIGTPEGKN